MQAVWLVLRHCLAVQGQAVTRVSQLGNDNRPLQFSSVGGLGPLYTWHNLEWPALQSRPCPTFGRSTLQCELATIAVPVRTMLGLPICAGYNLPHCHHEMALRRPFAGACGGHGVIDAPDHARIPSHRAMCIAPGRPFFRSVPLVQQVGMQSG